MMRLVVCAALLAGSSMVVFAQADLSINQSGPASVIAGNNLTYNITVSNNGLQDATTVQWNDPLPSGSTFVSLNQGSGPTFGCTPPPAGSGGTVNCSLATLAAGQSSSFTLVIKVSSGFGSGTVSNTVSVNAASPADPNPANNTLTLPVQVTTSAHISITVTGPATVSQEDTVTFVVSIVNTGPSDSGSLLEQGTAGASGIVPVFFTGAVITGSGTISVSGNTITIMVNSLAAGATFSASVSMTPTPLAPGSASLSIGGSSATINIVNQADLSITKSGPQTALANSNITYLITASNAGPSPAMGATITDVIPANTSFVSATPSQGSCSGTATVTCSMGTINSGGAATVTLVLQVNAGGVVSNTASVASTTPDPNLANNTSAPAQTLIVNSIPTLSNLALALEAALLLAAGLAMMRVLKPS